MLSDIHCPLHMSLVIYTTSELKENTPDTMNVENNIFRRKWNPKLTTQFTETLEKENIDGMMSDIISILVEFPNNANIDRPDINQRNI